MFFDHTAKMGGGEIALLNLVKGFDRRLFDVLVVLASPGPLVDRLTECGIATHVLPLDAEISEVRKDALGAAALLNLKVLFQTLRYARDLSRLIQARRIELVHTNSLKSDLIGGIAARLAGCPVVWHVRDRIAKDYLPAPVVRVFRALCRLIPNRLIVNSGATAQTLAANPNRARPIITVVHDGTEVGETSPPVYCAAGHEPLIGLVGRITPWKGQHIFLEAAAVVLQKFPQARFQIIGAPLFAEQAYEASLRELADRLGITPRIEFTGFRSDVADLIARLDLLVHASTTGEPFGQVVIEAMAAGKPVVATRGGGIPEIVIDRITGLLVPMNDASAMAVAIEQIIADPRAAAVMGANGFRRVSDHFSIQRTVNGVQTVFAEMLNRAVQMGTAFSRKESALAIMQIP
ncbi:MAG: glycosyltransferase family 4 protein [Planctomycetota bacterium]|nr:glycosyltransferase family 4 protein [Planctomycetota bacterium]